MSLARIHAVSTDAETPGDTIDVLLEISADMVVQSAECFGQIYDDGKRYPFVGRPESSAYKLDFGAWAETKKLHESRLHDLIGHHVKAAGTFIREDVWATASPDENVIEYTYRITTIRLA